MLKIRKILDILGKSWYTKFSTQRVRVLNDFRNSSSDLKNKVREPRT